MSVFSAFNPNVPEEKVIIRASEQINEAPY